ncbi:hypothetical protein [Pedobacter sp. BMA]|uniref:hypothetical protein n=1 Tax=Pedobacter sp. BMA TaxID=1663685 RepID=UPI00064B47D5|nr:hypothetical protein [Pedobacter sp. BMA]KLT63908.1 hypothetical protein AB669_19455 [Pedobacter sp. BMA]
MQNLNLRIITANIFDLLEHSGLTDLAFVYIIEISDKQLRLIRNGKAEFGIDEINKAAAFFLVTINELNEGPIEIESEYREILASIHSKNYNYAAVLELRPSITHALRFGLAGNSVFEKVGLTTGEMKQAFLEKGWAFQSKYISTGIARNKDLFEVAGTKIIKGLKVNIYKAKSPDLKIIDNDKKDV